MVLRPAQRHGHHRLPPPVRVYLRYQPPATAQVVCQEGRAVAVEVSLMELVRLGHATGDLVDWRSQT
eukprot:10652397-Alexandrium_andersonii.AAC.1